LPNTQQRPSFAEEELLASQGYRLVAGVDEVGRGALAGPVVAAAVVLPLHLSTHWLDRVRDSKQLSPGMREYLFEYIKEAAIAVGVGISSYEVIDAQGIARATRLAMKQAIAQLLPPPQHLLIDYLCLPEVPLPQKGIVYGDSRCYSIACASIMAKVTRDRMMIELDSVYPGYRLAKHKGYGTEEHLSCLRRLGPSPVHRRSFQPLKGMVC